MIGNNKDVPKFYLVEKGKKKMIHIKGIEKIPEKYLAEFKTKNVYEIIEKWRTDNQISLIKEHSEIA